MRGRDTRIESNPLISYWHAMSGRSATPRSQTGPLSFRRMRLTPESGSPTIGSTSTLEKNSESPRLALHGGGQVARVKSYGDVLLEYEYYPESKCADSDGNICSKQTIGLLQRRHIRIDQIKYLGKKSNSLEEVDAGLVHSEQNVYTEFPDPRRDEWRTKILSALRTIPLTVLEEMSELSRRVLIDIRAGRSRLHRKNHETY